MEVYLLLRDECFHKSPPVNRLIMHTETIVTEASLYLKGIGELTCSLLRNLDGFCAAYYL